MSDLSAKITGREQLAAHPDPAALLAAIDRFRNVKVLVVGDFILDRFVHGVIERISPEAPIPVLHGRKETSTLGGAGNVVSNVVSLGGTALPVAAIGSDAAGNATIAMLKKQGADVSGIIASPARMTSSKSRFSALNQQVLRFDEEEIRPLSADERQAILERFRKSLEIADIVILSDYGKGMLIDGVAGELIALCRAAGKQVIVDPKGRDYSRYAGATVVSPNRKELGEAVGRTVSTDDEIVAAARQLIDAHGFDFVLATRSEKGMSIVSGRDERHIATQAREVFDVSGAGDTVVASFALSLAAGLDRHTAATVANTAAGVVVGKRGTARVSVRRTRRRAVSWRLRVSFRTLRGRSCDGRADRLGMEARRAECRFHQWLLRYPPYRSRLAHPGSALQCGSARAGPQQRCFRAPPQG